MNKEKRGTLKVKVHKDNEKFSAWSKPMEDFILKQKDRIITIYPLEGAQEGYFKCHGLDYFVFHDLMFTRIENILKSEIEAIEFLSNPINKNLVLISSNGMSYHSIEGAHCIVSEIGKNIYRRDRAFKLKKA